MEHKDIIASAIVLSLIIAGMFAYTYFKKKELQDIPKNTAIQTDVESPYASITSIDAKHFFKVGMHTIVGVIVMPTQCDLLSWSVHSDKTDQQSFTIDFTVINHSTDCEKISTPQRFKVSFEGSEAVAIQATFQGKPIILNLVPGSPDEFPEDFELFIKG